jgi:hypothetical protein
MIKKLSLLLLLLLVYYSWNAGVAVKGIIAARVMDR